MKIKFFLFLLLSFSHCIFAKEQQSQLWLDASINDELGEYENFDYVLEVQTRMVNEQGYETSFIAAGLGYRYTDNLSFWAGYEWIAPDVIDNIPHADRIWEQMVWQVYDNDTVTIRTRTLLEQTRLAHQPEWANHFREKVSFYFPGKLFNHYTPLIYDEVFVKLNDPEWMEATNTIEANNLFIGLDIPVTKTSFLEAGYIHQSLFNDTDNAVNHILYLGINFNPSGRTYPQYVR
jgi:hypothetical protein